MRVRFKYKCLKITGQKALNFRLIDYMQKIAHELKNKVITHFYYTNLLLVHFINVIIIYLHFCDDAFQRFHVIFKSTLLKVNASHNF